MSDRSRLEGEIETRLDELGFELVEFSWAGSRQRPILRLRIDHAEPGSEGITVDDCARVSRSLESWLDEDDSLPERYVLEVSSPGVERRLSRPRDWERFAGKEISVKRVRADEEGALQLEGELLGSEGEGESLQVRIRLPDGEEHLLPARSIAEARLVFRWE